MTISEMIETLDNFPTEDTTMDVAREALRQLATERKLADEMADGVIYYFKIQELAPAKPEIEYYRVRAKAKVLLRTAVADWQNYRKNKSK